MPRIRNWQDLKLYRADANAKYKHIDRLFSDTVDWDLIAFHWQDLMQVALSIQAGTISSPLLLRRFGSESRRNRLFLAAQELGKVVRTALQDAIAARPAIRDAARRNPILASLVP